MTGGEFARLLRDAVPEPPSVLSAEGVVRRARRRLAGRVCAVGGTAVVAAAAALFVVSNTGGGTGTLAGASPTASPATTLPGCQSGSLRALATGGGIVSNGFTGATITLTNIGSEPCRLAERITSLLAAKTGIDLPIEPVATDQGGPQDLVVGRSAAFTVASLRDPRECARPAPAEAAAPPVLSFEVAGSGPISVGLERGVFTLRCWPIVVSRMFVPPTEPSPAAVATGPFTATDVSFVSTRLGWAVSPGRLRQTTDGGRTWTRLPAPPQRADRVRFATERIGYAWALGQQLYLTGDGGQTWQPTRLGLVRQVEAAAGYVWALAGDEPYPGVWRAPVGAASFAQFGTTPDRTGTLDVHGAIAYVVGVQGAGPFAGSIDVWTGGRRTNKQLPCRRDNALYVPSSPLGVSTDGSVVLVCDIEQLGSGQSPRPGQWAYVSTDQGDSWTRVPGPAQHPLDVTATRQALFVWGDNVERYDGSRWTVVLPGNGFATVGFQDDDHGVALGTDGVLHLTSDGGLTWTTTTW